MPTGPDHARDAGARTDRPLSPAVVFDVLGTLVDQPGGLQEKVQQVGVGAAAAAAVVERWLAEVAARERQVIDGHRPFIPSHALDTEVLEHLVSEGLLPPTAVTRLADASSTLRPWPDTIAGLDRFAEDAVVVGLSNASRRVLAALSRHGGLRWHQLLSAEDAGTYKPAPGLYEAAMAAVPPGAEPPIMVAAHAWDLRAAAAVGMRTAYVPRRHGNPPRANDIFDFFATDLRDLHAQITAMADPRHHGAT